MRVLGASALLVACAAPHPTHHRAGPQRDARAVTDGRAETLVADVTRAVDVVAPCLAHALPDAPRFDLTTVPTRATQLRAITTWIEHARGHRFVAPPAVRAVTRAAFAAAVARTTPDRIVAGAVASVSDATSDGRTIMVVDAPGEAALADDTLLAVVHELDRLLVAPGVAAHAPARDDAALARQAVLEGDATIVTAVFARVASMHDHHAAVDARARRLAALPSAVARRLLWPYTAALPWICARTQPLTPSALDAALAHPPPTTAALGAPAAGR